MLPGAIAVMLDEMRERRVLPPRRGVFERYPHYSKLDGDVDAKIIKSPTAIPHSGLLQQIFKAIKTLRCAQRQSSPRTRIVISNNFHSTSLNMASGVPFDAEQAGNNEEMEQQFAVKAVEQMEVYWSILEKMPGSKLRLTRLDDEIFEHLKKDFPDFDPAAEINEEEMKSKDGKERWRKFCMAYAEGENKVEDYNFGTMLRRSPKFEYGQDEAIFAVRVQFYAIEIARNRAGLNDWIYEKAQADAKR